MTTSGPGASTTEGVEHLQAAAREMLAAARSFLDAVEEVVADREKMSAVATVVVDAFETVSRSLSSLAAEPARSARDGEADDSTTSTRIRRVVVE